MEPSRLAGGAPMTTRMLENRWLYLGLRLLLGGVFLYAGTLKLISPQPFADSIATFRLLPEAVINLLALGLPVFELSVGCLLFSGRLSGAASLAALVMTSVFALAMVSALIRGLPVDCGCFGSGAPAAHHGWIALGRDLILSGVAFVLYRRELWRHAASKDTALEAATSRGLSPEPVKAPI